jgi:hypothetical protein
MAGLTAAFKEWAIAVEALLSGDLILLLRKGGLREKAGQLQVQVGNRGGLLPTLEHQRPHLLKSPWQEQAVLASPDRPRPTALTLQGWADITHVQPLRDAAQVARLTPCHIWTSQWVQERMAWQPERPIYLLLLRVYRLPQPQTVPYHPTYGGCRSWVTLQTEVATADSQAVLSETDYQQRVTAISRLLGT